MTPRYPERHARLPPWQPRGTHRLPPWADRGVPGIPQSRQRGRPLPPLQLLPTRSSLWSLRLACPRPGPGYTCCDSEHRPLPPGTGREVSGVQRSPRTARGTNLCLQPHLESRWKEPWSPLPHHRGPAGQCPGTNSSARGETVESRAFQSSPVARRLLLRGVTAAPPWSGRGVTESGEIGPKGANPAMTSPDAFQPLDRRAYRIPPGIGRGVSKSGEFGPKTANRSQQCPDIVAGAAGVPTSRPPWFGRGVTPENRRDTLCYAGAVSP